MTNKKFVNFNEENSIGKYFKEIRKSELLTIDEEIDLAKRIKAGDTEAVTMLVNANLKFVISIAKEYQGQGLLFSDLISEGNYGLIKAAMRFDHTKGFRFISYAVWWIKQAILQGLNDNARTVRLPTNVISKLNLIKKEIDKFVFENERQPITDELTNINDAELTMLLTPKCTSLNTIISEDGTEVGDLIQDNDSLENNEYYHIDDRLKKELNKTLSVLDDRERDIIECYFGLNKDSEPLTLEVIGNRYGLTKERVRQLKKRAIHKLRFNSEGLYLVIND